MEYEDLLQTIAEVAIAFVWKGVGKIDPAATEGTIGFRLLIIPGTIALWPILARRWLQKQGPPQECNAHRILSVNQQPRLCRIGRPDEARNVPCRQFHVAQSCAVADKRNTSPTMGSVNSGRESVSSKRTGFKSLVAPLIPAPTRKILERPPTAAEAAFGGPPRYDWIDIVSQFHRRIQGHRLHRFHSTLLGPHDRAGTNRMKLDSSICPLFINLPLNNRAV